MKNVCLTGLSLSLSLSLSLFLLSLVACGGGGDSASATLKAGIAEAVAGRLDAELTKTQNQHPWVPGIVASVQVDDAKNSFGLDWTGAVGMADREVKTPMRRDSRYVMASVTKTYVAAAILRLVERDQLQLTDTLDRVLGQDSLSRLRIAGYAVDRVTVDMLLAHTGGLRDYISDAYLAAVASEPHRLWTRTEQLQLALDQGPPLAAPGSVYRYADTGYILLGEVLETRTGLGLPKAVRSLLGFDTLDLRATAWQAGDTVPPSASGTLSHPYITFGDQVLDFLALDPSIDLYGGGGLVSSAADAATFMRLLVEGRILSRASVVRMQTPGPGGFDPFVGGSYGRGLTRFDIDGAVCWGHVGAWGVLSAHCPDIGVTLAFTLNCNGDPAGRDGFDALALARALVAAVR